MNWDANIAWLMSITDGAFMWYDATNMIEACDILPEDVSR